jgi:ABC-type polysaccharide/polyol phosphate transport system ATPase subunit
VLRWASLMICSEELVGLLGENGSGKSTLMQIVVGLLGRDSGSVDQLAGWVVVLAATVYFALRRALGGRSYPPTIVYPIWVSERS